MVGGLGRLEGHVRTIGCRCSRASAEYRPGDTDRCTDAVGHTDADDDEHGSNHDHTRSNNIADDHIADNDVTFDNVADDNVTDPVDYGNRRLNRPYAA